MDATAATSASVNSLIDPSAYDEPYRFGRRPTVRAPFPFTEREFARLLIVRSRIHAAGAASDHAEAA